MRRQSRDRADETERRTPRPGATGRGRPHRRRGPAGLSTYGRPEPSTHQAVRDRARHSWPRAFDGMGDDGDAGEWEERRERREVRSWMQRQRQRVASSKLRKPLVGLAVAGAAAPLVRAGTQPDGGKSAKTEAGASASMAEAAAATATAEDNAERLQAEEKARVRDEMIQAAVNRHGISWNLAANIHDIAEEEGIDPNVAYGLVKTESTFRHRAVSPVGARGLTQLLPSTAKWMMPEIRSNDQLFEEETNLRVGFRYLRYLLDKYRGDEELALLAYNRGPGTVDRVLSRGGNPDNGYANKVLGG